MRANLGKHTDAVKPNARWRPRFQFSLRMLLVAVTVVSVWLGWNLHRAQQQREAVLAIQAYGGDVVYDFEYDYGRFRIRDAVPATPKWLLKAAGVDFFHSVWAVNLREGRDSNGNWNHNESTDVFDRLEELPEIRALLLCGGQASDRSLERIANLRSLELLQFATRFTDKRSEKPSRPAISDAGMAPLAKLTNLRSLYIGGAPLGDKSLETIGRLKKLEYLSLGDEQCTFSDAGLKALSGLSRLKNVSFDLGYGVMEFSDEGLATLAQISSVEEIWISGEFTDRGLIALASLPQLKTVYLGANDVTPAGQAEFKSLAPKATLTLSGHVVLLDDMQVIIAQVGKLKRATLTPDDRLRDLPLDDARRAELIPVLKEAYFALDADTAESFVQKLESNPDITIRQMTDLVKSMIGR